MKKVLRLITDHVQKDLEQKIVIIAGPRQCGKTTLAKNLSTRSEYLNYDNLDDRSVILQRTWDRGRDLVIFDELHKMPKWKSWVKGIYDKEKGKGPQILVTGSAKLDAFKKVGDSLAGRHFYYRLHPFDCKEIALSKMGLKPDQALERLLSVGGYPEPFIANEKGFYNRWRRGHLDLILKQDLVEFEAVRDIQSILILIELLRSRVGSGISVHALAMELQKDSKTVQRWLNILEDLFVIFRMTPYAREISRSLKKEPKFYFYDTGLVLGDEGAKLENVVACALLKETHRLADCLGVEYSLNYLKVKGGREIDFLLHPKERSAENPALLIEVKQSQTDASPNFKLFGPLFRNSRKIQLVQNLPREFTTAEQVQVVKASHWLAELPIEVK